jgi:hypothetical protein
MSQSDPSKGDEAPESEEWAERVGEDQPYPLEVWTDPATAEEPGDDRPPPSEDAQ